MNRCVAESWTSIIYSTPMRLEITRKTDLAIRALIVLGQQTHKLKASVLAEHIHTTSGFLSQVMTPLVAMLAPAGAAVSAQVKVPPSASVAVLV